MLVRRRALRRRQALLAAAVLVPLSVLGASGCEQSADIRLTCQALGQQSVRIRTNDTPEQITEYESVQFEIQPELFTGIPAPDAPVIYDVWLPTPTQLGGFGNVQVKAGGNVQVRAFVVPGYLWLRYAGGTGTVATAELPAVVVSGYVRSGIAPTDIKWKVPDKIAILSPVGNLLGGDLCTPIDPDQVMNTTHVDRQPPGSYPGGTSPGTRPPVVTATSSTTTTTTTVTLPTTATTHGH
jgi:hypothetical protein